MHFHCQLEKCKHKPAQKARVVDWMCHVYKVHMKGRYLHHFKKLKIVDNDKINFSGLIEPSVWATIPINEQDLIFNIRNEHSNENKQHLYNSEFMKKYEIAAGLGADCNVLKEQLKKDINTIYKMKNLTPKYTENVFSFHPRFESNKILKDENFTQIPIQNWSKDFKEEGKIFGPDSDKYLQQQSIVMLKQNLLYDEDNLEMKDPNLPDPDLKIEKKEYINKYKNLKLQKFETTKI